MAKGVGWAHIKALDTVGEHLLPLQSFKYKLLNTELFNQTGVQNRRLRLSLVLTTIHSLM